MKVTQSELKTYKRCKRQWWLSYYRRLGLRAVDVAGPSAVGTKVHNALERYYAYGEDPLVQVDFLVEQDVVAYPEMETAIREDGSLCRIMLEGYLEWLAETGIDSDLEVLSTEETLEVFFAEIHGQYVTLLGKLDMRVRRRSDNARLFLDHKTVPDLTTPTKTLHLDEQMFHYMLLERLSLAEKQAKGTVYVPSAAHLSGNGPGTQSTASMAVPAMREANPSDGYMVGPPQGRGSHEQHASQSAGDALRVPFQSAQQGEDGHVQSGASPENQRSSEEAGPINAGVVGGIEVEELRSAQEAVGLVHPGAARSHRSEHQPSSDPFEWVDGGLYNMLRKVKRTARAKPPFFAREEVRHNVHELRSYWKRVYGMVSDIITTKMVLDTGGDPLVACYPTPRKDCSWDCDFFAVCGMFDDGSDVEPLLADIFTEIDPHQRYADKPAGDAVG